MFEFQNPGCLVDEELELILVKRQPGDVHVDPVPAYVFDMRFTGTETTIGCCDLRIGDTYNLAMYSGHIGFTVFPDHRGHKYAARATKLLLPLARSHGIETFWITCDPDNPASRTTCELVGATFVEVVALEEDTNAYQQGDRQKCRYKLELKQ